MTLGIWGDSVPRRDVQEAVEAAFARFELGSFLVDVRNWRTEAEAWGEKFGEVVVAFPTNSPTRRAPVIDRFTVAAGEGDLHHAEDPELDAQIANARTRPSRSGHTLDVAHPDRPIGGVTAALIEFEAAATMPAESGRFVFVGWV